ncbi:DNA repair protein RecO [Acetobacter conturbans]|uniref:DNA repair protein RecO n=1 Tax=Acetobacter conturbans TaxID=1737472 RepID=A0ABX0JWF8_9PROT|nr:DNA repair protein RecO [Acetobacter conturbans]NHN87184.1 DNA repair protein RecO [Acetobacter conturbans]
MKEGGASLEWEAPALVLSAVLFGEADALVHLFSPAQGVTHGLVKGGFGRRNAATWQPGNLVQAHWRARVPGQLGTVAGELAAPNAARALSSRESLACLTSLCAVADSALAESEPYPGLCQDSAQVLAMLGTTDVASEISIVIRWETILLRDLGFALDVSCCAVTGQTEDLIYVSPRTGRAVSGAGAGAWADRLLPLPPFLLTAEATGTPDEWRDGLRLTGHFLTRDVFGPIHRSLPAARIRLADMVQSLQAE